MACGCASPGGRTKWGVSILLAVSAVVCMLAVGPVYVSTLASHDPKAFVGCAGCIQDFAMDTLHSVNATDIAKKIQKIHERNERAHPGRDDECITNRDIDQLLPDLEGLHFPDWKAECKEKCTPVMKTLPLAAALASMIMFVGILCGIGAIIPLCMLCCGCKKEVPPAPQAYVYVPPHAPGGGPYSMPVPVGTSTGAPADDAKRPLLQHQA